MKFFIPNSVIDRYSFRARGKLLLENMANNHGYINDYQLIKNTNELYIIGKEFDHNVIQHCNENNIAMAVGVDEQVTQAYDLGIAKKMENVEYTPE